MCLLQYRKLWMRLSLRDPNNKEKYLGEDATWDKAEASLRSLLTEKNIPHKEAEGEAAFYGPKIDLMAVDALGREWQLSTIQLDFVQPSRFELEYTAEDGSKKTPVMIHRALIGSPDRFLGILIEHNAGAFPTWLAPEQVRILPISTEKHAEYGEEVLKQLTSAGIHAMLDSANESLGKKIRTAKTEKVTYLLVIGDAEMEANTVSVESRDEGKLDAVPVADFVERIKKEIAARA